MEFYIPTETGEFLAFCAAIATVVFGLSAALAWGAGDFGGGLASRRSPVYGVVLVAQLVGMVIAAALGLALGQSWPAGRDLGVVVVAGILGNNQTNKGNVEAQTAEAMARIERTMKAAGFSFADLADAVVYITDVSYFQAMNNAYRAAIGKDFPARATVKTGLVGPEGLVEIMFVAAK